LRGFGGLDAMDDVVGVGGSGKRAGLARDACGCACRLRRRPDCAPAFRLSAKLRGLAVDVVRGTPPRHPCRDAWRGRS
jgi:hypothetical protein